MRREFKGKICPYCSLRVSKTDDHIFAAKFFLERDRLELPKAPCCRVCNGNKSTLEHYLTAVLPFGGRHEQAAENLTTAVPGRLEGNHKLARNISSTMNRAWLKEGDGIYQRTSTMSFDSGKLRGLLVFIGRGLAWHHWGVYLSQTDVVDVMFLTDLQSAVFPTNLRPENFPVTVRGTVGNGTFTYEGMQAREPLNLTVWKVVMYGGILLSDDGESAPAETRSQWWIITGPPEVSRPQR